MGKTKMSQTLKRQLERGERVERTPKAEWTPECPVCKEVKRITSVDSFVENRVIDNYYCPNCEIEFNLRVVIYPYIWKGGF